MIKLPDPFFFLLFELLYLFLPRDLKRLTNLFVKKLEKIQQSFIIKPYLSFYVNVHLQDLLFYVLKDVFLTTAHDALN